MKSVTRTAGSRDLWEFNGDNGQVFLFVVIQMAGLWVVTSGLQSWDLTLNYVGKSQKSKRLENSGV